MLTGRGPPRNRDSDPRSSLMPGRSPSLLVRRPSKIAGWGVFARRTIAKHTCVLEYAGERISHRESARRERQQFARGRIWCFTVSPRIVRDASVGGNLARFINHACRPNCYSQVIGQRIWIRAARRIAAGEELTYDYHTRGEAGIRCRCRPGCETML